MEKLIGLVLCGGESKRMGKDKGLLKYHQQQQRLHAYHLLEQICSSVFICCRNEQAATLDSNYNYILDQSEFENKGPLTAILSAQKQFSQHHFLVLGCDYPLLNKEDIIRLYEVFQTNWQSTFYINEANYIEPLIGIYNQKDLAELKEVHELFKHSLQSFLRSKNINQVNPSNPEIIKSFDHFEDWKNYSNRIDIY